MARGGMRRKAKHKTRWRIGCDEAGKMCIGREEDIAVAGVKRSSSDCDRAVVTPP